MRKKNLNRFKGIEQIDISHPHYLVYKPLIRDLSRVIKKYAYGKVLDIGCGNKPYKSLFDNKYVDYLGCDVVQSNQNKVDLICHATDIPLANSSIDTIFCTQVIEHIEDTNALLKEVYRLLVPNGVIILSGPMYWHLHEEPHDFFRFTKYGFRALLENYNFDIIEITANGGKWSTFGQMVIHTFPNFLVKRKFFRILNNKLFYYLNQKNYNDYNTMNYVVVAKSKKNNMNQNQAR